MTLHPDANYIRELQAERDQLASALAELVETVGRSGWHHADPLISNRAKRAELLNRARHALKTVKG